MIRLANKFDIQDIIRLMKQYAETSDIALKANPLNWSKTYIENILTEIIAGKGFVLIDENKTGILVAIKSPIFWIENSIQLQEVMLHCENKITMMRLIKEYINIAKQMLDEHKITHAVMFSDPNAKFDKIGLNKLEITWEI